MSSGEHELDFMDKLWEAAKRSVLKEVEEVLV